MLRIYIYIYIHTYIPTEIYCGLRPLFAAIPLARRAAPPLARSLYIHGERETDTDICIFLACSDILRLAASFRSDSVSASRRARSSALSLYIYIERETDIDTEIDILCGEPHLQRDVAYVYLCLFIFIYIPVEICCGWRPLFAAIPSARRAVPARPPLSCGCASQVARHGAPLQMPAIQAVCAPTNKATIRFYYRAVEPDSLGLTRDVYVYADVYV